MSQDTVASTVSTPEVTTESAVTEDFPAGDAVLECPALPEHYEAFDAEPTDDGFSVKLNERTLTFNASGYLTGWSDDERRAALDYLAVDVGWNEETVLGQAGYSDMERLQTWDLPVLAVRNQELPATVKVVSWASGPDTLMVRQQLGAVLWDTYYTDLDDALEVRTEVTNLGEKTAWVNGVNFVLAGLELPDDVCFEYPGSLPYGRFGKDIGAFTIIATEYSSPVTHIANEKEAWDILFVNPSEKWRTGTFFDWKGKLGIHHLSATQADLEPGSSLSVGSLYLQLPTREDPDDLSDVRRLYARKGWEVPDDGAPFGPVYVGHPYGTMDTGFTHPSTLQEYAEQLPRIHAMGYDYIWLLPIFKHPGNSVYAPPDQTVIDPRYGGREGAETFIRAAHDLGIGVLFDLVPHGPEPHEAIVKEHPDWPSRRRDGELQIEWDCVSFDYNQASYMDYTYDFVRAYSEELGLDGARIDCAMGGLSNWSPAPGFRPSESGLQAGLTISRTVREAVKDGGRAPMILPENFHPVPQYAPYTDLFYDMTLYRVIFELRTKGAGPEETAQTLTRWLRMQREASPDGLVHLRYLSNHDTADWTWDAARPVTVHGLDRAKAYWVLLSLIDGVPMLHAGDEDASLYHHGGYELTSFFTRLNELRATRTEATMPTIYEERDDALIVFRREDEASDKEGLRVAINFGSTAESVDVEGDPEMLESSRARRTGRHIILEPNGYVILK